MSTRARKAVAVTTAIAACSALLAFSSGCASNSLTGLRLSPTPELMTLADTPDDIANDYAIMSNMNLRMIKEDFNRGMLIDRPVRLSPAPIPH